MFSTLLAFRVLWNVILDNLKSFCYFSALGGALTYAVPKRVCKPSSFTKPRSIRRSRTWVPSTVSGRALPPTGSCGVSMAEIFHAASYRSTTHKQTSNWKNTCSKKSLRKNRKAGIFFFNFNNSCWNNRSDFGQISRLHTLNLFNIRNNFSGTF